MMKKFKPFRQILFGLAILLAHNIFSQTPTVQDCLGAQSICNYVYQEQDAYSGEGNFENEINSLSSCLDSGEKNDIWYTFTVQNSGELNFTITPNDPNDDYDWAVYNLTNATCEDIATDPSLEVSCNYSPNIGCGGLTGPNGNTAGSCGGQNEPTITVVEGETYVVNVSQFSMSTAGYSIDFSSSTASIFDQAPPFLDTLLSNVFCGVNQLQIRFSEFILCNSVDFSDFIVITPNLDTIAIDSIYSSSCSSGGHHDNIFTLYFEDNINISGWNILIFNGEVFDLCSNVNTGSDSISFFIDSIHSSVWAENTRCNGTSDGIAHVEGQNGTEPYSYQWFDSNNDTIYQTDSVATGLPTGFYYVNIEDSLGCKTTDSIEVLYNNYLDFSYEMYLDSCSAGVGAVLIDSVEGTPPYTFFWHDSTITDTGAIATGLSAGAYIVTVTDSFGCYVTDTAIVDGTTPPYAEFTFKPEVVPMFSPDVDFYDQSIDANSWYWDFGDGETSNGQITQHSYSDTGLYIVTLVITDEYGCTDTAQLPLRVKLEFTLYIPNAFTPDGDGLNDTFGPVVEGLDTTNYDFWIFSKWGKLVFHSQDINNRWDGSVEGVPWKWADTFSYKIFCKDYNGRKYEYFGRVTIVK